MVRGLVRSLASVILVLGLGVRAAAAGTGEIRVLLDCGGAGESEVVLYQVARQDRGGYLLGESLGGGMIRPEEATSAELAAWLAERSLNGGTVCRTEAGEAVFSDLEDGLYLLLQTQAPDGWQKAAPFLIPMPLNGQREILARPKTAERLTESPRTGQRPDPLFAAMGLVLSGTGLYFCLEKLHKK